MPAESPTTPVAASPAPAANPSNATGPAVQLFQRAHQKMTMLARIDEQLMHMLERRRQLQEELRSVQSEINEEFDRMIRLVDDPGPAAREAAAVVGAAGNGNGNGHGNGNGRADRDRDRDRRPAPDIRRTGPKHFAVEPLDTEAAVA